MIVINGKKSFSKKQITKFRIKKYSAYLAFLIILLLYCTYLRTHYSQSLNTYSLLIIISMTLGMFFCLVCIWLFKKINSFLDNTEAKIGTAKVGDIGEKVVLTKLQEILDKDYSVYPNYIIPGRKFDIDFLIVGPKGLIAMEVKNYSDRMLFFENKAIKVRGSGYTREVTKLDGDYDPRNKFKNHCNSFNHYLYSIGLDNVRVRRVLVFINDDLKIEERPGTFIVQGIDNLYKYFNTLRPDDRFTPEFCAVINEKLKEH